MFVVDVPEALPVIVFGNPEQEAQVDPAFLEYSAYATAVVHPEVLLTDHEKITFRAV
jgi:hypothetical protein